MRISDWSSDVCSSDLPGKAELHGLGLADETGQALRAAGAGNGADGDFRLAELGAVGGKDEVAHHGDLAAATQRIARHSGDHRLARLGEALPALGDEVRSEEHTSELQSLMRISYAVFCLK